MDLSRICIDSRLRSSWEAVDLGFVMARRWYLPLLLCWALPCLPIALLFGYLLSDMLWVALLIVWWCKPLLDRLPLIFISQALFDEPVRVRTVLRQLPTIWRIQWLPWLTTRRFNFTRSFDLPVSILERLTGKTGSQRLNILHRQNTGAAIWLTIVCFCLELLFTIGCFAFITLLIPDQVDLQFLNPPDNDDHPIYWVDFIMCCIAMAVIAPLYIASGFALYISRRIELEAWDIEIRFRHLAAKQSQHPLAKTAVVCLCCILIALGNASNTFANDKPRTDNTETELPETQASLPTAEQKLVIDSSEQAKQLVDNILATDDFHVMKEVTRWRLKPISSNEGGNTLPNWFIQCIEWLEAWLFSLPDPEEDELDFSKLALILEIMLWCAAIIAIGIVIYIYRQDLQHLINRLTTKPTLDEDKPQTLFGLDVRRDSLPDDIPAEVKRLSAQDNFRQALGLLYRATLSGLMHQYGYTFYDSYTEGECIQVVRSGGHQSLSQFTEELTLSWQQLAYGHHTPANTAVDQLCGRWQELFSHEN